MQQTLFCKKKKKKRNELPTTDAHSKLIGSPENYAE